MAILTTPRFDATHVDPLSVRFGPAGATEVHRRGHIEDVDGDGDLDIVLHFETTETGIRAGDTEASLTGKTGDGSTFKGKDAIVTSPRGKIVASSVEESGASLPTTFALLPPSPNPFNAQTTIRYTLPYPSRLVLTVYNLRGHPVRALLDASHPAGSYTVVWDGKDQKEGEVSRGIYFIWMEAEGFRAVRKMAMIR